MFNYSSQQKKNLPFEKDKENGRKLIDESSTRVCLDLIHNELLPLAFNMCLHHFYNFVFIAFFNRINKFKKIKKRFFFIDFQYLNRCRFFHFSITFV
jgi:hypothetical protein